MGNDLIRMSGMNSGLDTESIINALTANSKLKITKQERNVMKFEETQKAYQDVTSKMTALKDKYFNLLNSQNNLTGSSMWNKYAATTYLDGTQTTIAGFSASTTVNSQPGEYTMKVKTNAKQAEMKGSSLSGNASVSTDELSAFAEGQTYGFTIDVAGTTKNITFTGGADAEATLNNINQALEDEFGESNESVGDRGNRGMVYIDPDTLQFTTRDGKGMTVSGIGSLTSSNEINVGAASTGNNTLTFQVGSETVNVSFQTISRTYFDDAINNGFIDTSTGSVLLEAGTDEFNAKIHEMAVAKAGEGASDEEIEQAAYKVETDINEAVAIYKGVVDDYKESVRYDAYKAWKETATDDDMNALYTAANAESKQERIGKWLEADSYVKSAYDEYKSGVEEGTEPDDIYTWAQSQRGTNASIDTKLNDLSDKYDGVPTLDYKAYRNSYTTENLSDESKAAYETYKSELAEGTEPDDIYTWAQSNSAASAELSAADEPMKSYSQWSSDYYNDGYTDYKNAYATRNLSDESKAAYETYKSELPEGTEADDIYTWAQGNETARTELADAEESFKSQSEWQTDKVESDSWNLNRATWETSESKTFDAYKKNVYNESDASYDLSKENIIRHYTESSLKNSIGNLETPSGVKFDVSLGSDGKAAITAYTESTTTDEDGNETTTKTNVDFSVTAARDSENNFGIRTATTAISQISNTTKISDLNLTAGSDGNYSFKINGQSFSFDGNTTVNDMMKKINASSAGVKMSYSSLDNAFTMTASKYGVDSEVTISDDAQGLMSALGLSGTVKNGSNLVVEINGQEYQSAGNSIEADGTTFTFTNKSEVGKEFTVGIEKDTSAIADVIKNFIKDYNQLVEDVYKYLDEKPEKDYYFLTDADKEDLDLSEKQEEKWEEKAKKGLLYHDTTVTSAMTSLRTALMGTVEGLDGNTFSLVSLGLKTQTDYNKHGMFADIDEEALNAAIEGHSDDIMKLFTDSENGIMKKFSDALDASVGTTGTTKGSLIRKAGLATGTSSTDNDIYRSIKRTKQRISSLTTRYENEQDRLWKRYSSMESMLGTLNNQQASFSSYFMQ